jgi:hypothetical protein
MKKNILFFIYFFYLNNNLYCLITFFKKKINDFIINKRNKELENKRNKELENLEKEVKFFKKIINTDRETLTNELQEDEIFISEYKDKFLKEQLKEKKSFETNIFEEKEKLYLAIIKIEEDMIKIKLDENNFNLKKQELKNKKKELELLKISQLKNKKQFYTEQQTHLQSYNDMKKRKKQNNAKKNTYKIRTIKEVPQNLEYSKKY